MSQYLETIHFLKWHTYLGMQWYFKHMQKYYSDFFLVVMTQKAINSYAFKIKFAFI